MVGMSRSTLPEHVRVLVVGAGFAGLAMAVKLSEAGEDDYVVVRIHTSEENRDEVVRFAEWALGRGSSYSRLSTVSIGLSMVTGSRLTFFIDGQFVCSGLVARALERTGSIFDRDSAHIAPADLAKYFLAA